MVDESVGREYRGAGPVGTAPLCSPRPPERAPGTVSSSWSHDDGGPGPPSRTLTRRFSLCDPVSSSAAVCGVQALFVDRSPYSSLQLCKLMHDVCLSDNMK